MLFDMNPIRLKQAILFFFWRQNLGTSDGSRSSFPDVQQKIKTKP